jgi:FKBP-type peptidyl-prolyl cis-trans isomerase SlyD
MSISEKMIVSVSYDLYVKTEGGDPELMESATAEKPLTFCFGIGMMLPKFENELKGLKTGDKFDFTIPCDDAYGQYNEEHVVDLPKDIFTIDGKFDDEMIFVGNVVPLMDADGNRLNAEVVEIAEETVTVDLNHPLAGEDLHFVGAVLDTHEATDAELQSFMGGGCSGCSCGGSCDDDSCSSEGSCGSGCGCH